ncbi:MAG TPA: SDR family oxidoreductase [Acidobacteriota bacterium]|nr:SDR family oxidoreductase [Acidobacteriota bacterium]
MPRPPIDNGTILITGASSGIGRELARQFATRARAIILVARRLQLLEQLSNEIQSAHKELKVHIEACDLNNLSSIDSMLTSVLQRAGQIDILVNNAGFGDPALFENADWQRIEGMIRVNVIAPTYLTHRLLPKMIERKSGGILNIGSGAGIAIMPGSAIYSATKYYLHGFSDALRAEVGDAGIVVTEVAPGPVETEFDAVAGGRLAGVPPPFMGISAEQCAREAIQGFEKNRAIVFPGFAYRRLIKLLPLVPRRLQRAVALKTGRKLREKTKPTVPQAVAR